jgi:hypothetical protein
VESDLYCERCKYNLRGLYPHGKCPECGHLVRRSLEAEQLRQSLEVQQRHAREVRRARRREFFQQILFMTPCLFLLCLGLSVGERGGVEFSPDSFRKREFTYSYIALLGKRVSERRNHASEGSPLQAYLLEAGHIDRVPDDQARWVRHYGSVGSAAFVLSRELESGDWVKWSRDQPDLAAVLWPAVVNAVQHHGDNGMRFAEMMLRESRGAKTPNEVRAAIAPYTEVLDAMAPDAKK